MAKKAKVTVISNDSALPLLNAALDSPEMLGSVFFFSNPRLPNAKREVRYLDAKNIPSKHRTSGGMTGRLG